MGYKSSELNSSWAAFGWRRSLLLRLLLTAFWTALVLIAGLYGVKRVLELEAAAPVPPEEAAPLSAPERMPLPAAEYASGAKEGSLAMVKKGKFTEEAEPAAPSTPAGRPKLRPVSPWGSGGKFAADMSQDAPAVRSPVRRRATAEGVVLNSADLARKIKVKGARPVSAATAKRYSGIDAESEGLRLLKLRQAEAEAASNEQLRHEQLILSGLILLAGIVLTIAGSRVIRALRLLEKPEGTHWTLK